MLQKAPTARPESEWLHVERPELRIVSEEEWDAVQRRLVSAREDYARQTRTRRQYQRDQDSKYLLPGFGRCNVCGGGLHVRSRGQNGGRLFTYACSAHYRQGPTICSHVEQWPMKELDREVLDSIRRTIEKDGDIIEETIADAKKQFEQTSRPDHAAQLQRELATVDRELGRLTDAIASGAGQIPTLVERMRTTEAKRRALSTELERTRQTRPAPAWRDIERRMRKGLADWQSRFTDDVAAARAAFRELLTTPVRFTPGVEKGVRVIRWEGQIGLAAIFGGELVNEFGVPNGTRTFVDHRAGRNDRGVEAARRRRIGRSDRRAASGVRAVR